MVRIGSCKGRFGRKIIITIKHKARVGKRTVTDLQVHEGGQGNRNPSKLGFVVCGMKVFIGGWAARGGGKEGVAWVGTTGGRGSAVPVGPDFFFGKPPQPWR